MGLLSDEPSFQHESRQVSPAHLLSGVGFFLPCASVSMGTAEGHLPRNTAAPCAEDDRGLGTAPPPVTNPRKSGPSTRRGNRASGAGAAAKNRQLIEHNKREFEPQRRLWRLRQSSWRGFPHQAHARLRPMGPWGAGRIRFRPQARAGGFNMAAHEPPADSRLRGSRGARAEARGNIDRHDSEENDHVADPAGAVLPFCGARRG